MKHRSAAFPLVVGLITTSGENLSEPVLSAISDIFQKLPPAKDLTPQVIHVGVMAAGDQIAGIASQAGVKYRHLQLHAEESHGTKLTAAAMEFIEGCDAVILVSDGAAGIALADYVREVNRRLIQIDSTVPDPKADNLEQIESDQGWLPGLFATARLSPESDLDSIQRRMDDLANLAAPRTRGRWNWIVLFQGLAVCAPLAWFSHLFLGFSLQGAAAFTIITAVLLHAVIFTLRWRSMQKNWARARLVAEAARSMLATAACPAATPWRTLSIVPSLRPLRWIAAGGSRLTSFPKWRDDYITNRIDDQESYFTRKKKEAEAQRSRLSRWTTRLLDLVLALAFFGAVMGFFGQRWLGGIPGEVLQFTFGVGGVVFAVGLLVIQVMRELQDLNRRTARYAQQLELLQRARSKLAKTQSPAAAAELIEDTESKLLAEVLEWYFHAETAENFARSRETKDDSGIPNAPLTFAESSKRKLARKILGTGRAASGYVLEVVLGRVPTILISAAAAVAWIAYHAPANLSTPEMGSVVHLLDAGSVIAEDKKDLGELKDTFDPQPANGCVVLVHGLYGATSPRDLATAWMKSCAKAIIRRFNRPGQANQPAICLVDWEKAARPSQYFQLGFGEKNLIADISAIRPQAYAVGDYVATRLIKLINEGKIQKDRPIHLIGHSAGGFVVTRIALRLTQEGFISNPKLLRVTILDTPAPDEQITKELPKCCPTDFVLTSNLVWGLPFQKLKDFRTVPKQMEDVGMHLFQGDYKKILDEWYAGPCPNADRHARAEEDKSLGFWQRIWARMISQGTEFWKAHRSAYSWFELTIECPEKHQNEGFNCSPLLVQEQAGAH